MALPILFVKLFWVVKVLKYPVASFIATVREYRRRERVSAGGHVEQSFFHHPIRALSDRRFWVRMATNSAEIMVHVLSLFAWARNAVARCFNDCFIIWTPAHIHEPELFEAVEHAPWSVVLRRCAAWITTSFQLWHAPSDARVAVSSHGKRADWREVHFDGVRIAARVAGQAWRPLCVEVHRPNGVARLILAHDPPTQRVCGVVVQTACEPLRFEFDARTEVPLELRSG